MTKEGERFIRRPPWNVARALVAEVGLTVWHFGRSVEQKRKPADPKEAAGWLSLFYQALEDGSEFSADEAPAIERRVAAGFWFAVYSFQTARGMCVLKISHPHAPWFGQFSPSSEEYFREYRENLATQRQIYSPDLPYLILPQEVRFVQNARRGATLIVQPYVPHRRRVTDFRALGLSDQQRIIDEYDTFIALTKRLRGEGLQPDLILDRFVKAHNFIIAQTSDGPHLTLLDNGAIDLTHDAPLLNKLGSFAAALWPKLDRSRFTGINRKDGNQR